ncbi:probable tubulin polyglutamylase ttll-15 isoform X1 [Penaeus indicus]|uniref:probable tubulin polyglutamylase ttll-15 isoform X1 n=2 Tax=Penaeus indicus TaxID=29960 RepID=UPI00300D230A
MQGGGVGVAGAAISRRQMRFLVGVAVVLLFGAILTALNVYELHRLTKEHWSRDHLPGEPLAEARGAAHYERPVAWVRGNKKGSGYLMHVTNVFHRLGYELSEDGDDWDVLWSHNYPFRELKEKMTKLKPHQRVNHFPGSGFITNKVNLATSGLPYIPRAFRMPDEKEDLLKHAKLHSDLLFVQKSNNHRGIKIEKLDALDLGADGSFVQEFVHNPLLVDGYKFDIGVYTIVTSIQPLRVYIYEGDVLFRFCPVKYHPFDPEVRDKYVVGDDYLPTWKVPSLAKYYKDLGFGMKRSFDAWLKSQDKDSEVVWDAVRDAIRNVFYGKEMALVQATSHYPRSTNFFEMMRIDFVIDDQLKVHLMEANMSPNLSSSHFKENRLLYEQVVFNLLSLVGVGRAVHSASLAPSSREETEMQAAQKDVMVFPEHCAVSCSLEKACSKVECQLCKPCLSSEQQEDLTRAFLEHQRRGMCRRVVPPAIQHHHAHEPANMSGLSPENTLLTEWFRGQCLLDQALCS